jgi:putative intracellular protease/amidase
MHRTIFTLLILIGGALLLSAWPDGVNADAVKAQQKTGASSPKVYVCPPCDQDCDKLTFDKPGVCPHCGMTLIEKSERKLVTVAILLFNGVEIIDYSGPWEVFGQAGFKVHTVAVKAEPIKTTFGQRVVPDYTLEDCPPADILLIPGGNVSGVLLNNPKLIQWIQTRAKDARHVMSVCTGAFLLAKAGLLDGQSATTFHKSIDGLAQFAPKTKVVHDQRYVDNGKVITTAGLTSGMDGALHVVAKVLGKGKAQATALGLEYRWDPDAGYARAAFADRYLPRLQDLEAQTLSTEGDRDHWQTEALVSGPASAGEVLDMAGKQIVSGTPHARTAVTLIRSPGKGSPDKPEIRWKFTDDEGRGWQGVGTAEPSTEDRDKFIVTLKLIREGS